MRLEFVNDHATYASKYNVHKYSTTPKGSWALKPFMLERYLELFTYYHLEEKFSKNFRTTSCKSYPRHLVRFRDKRKSKYLLLFFQLFLKRLNGSVVVKCKKKITFWSVNFFLLKIIQFIEKIDQKIFTF